MPRKYVRSGKYTKAAIAARRALREEKRLASAMKRKHVRFDESGNIIPHEKRKYVRSGKYKKKIPVPPVTNTHIRFDD